MRRNPPYTPAEVLDISTTSLRFRVNTMVKFAEIFGFWKNPLKNAAASFDEISLTDIYYWVYKSKNPITRMESGKRPQDLFERDETLVRTPKDFKPGKSVSMSACGDLLRANSIENSKDVLFENVDDILFDQDISYANLESCITRQPLVDEVTGDRAAPIECCSEEQFDIIAAHRGKRFNVLNTANNHTFDMGIEGMEMVQKTFEKYDILNVGCNNKPHEYGEGKILTKGGIKFGFVSATFGLNGHEVRAEDEYRVNVSKLSSKFVKPDLELLKRQIDHCKSQECDFIIATLHWGLEFEMFPRMVQIEAARELAEYGADSILCHHPHVIQPIEYYRTKRDPNRIVAIAYSLGSLVWGFTAPHLALSIILNLKITKGSLKSKPVTYIQESKATPVFRGSVETGGKIITRIEKLSDHLHRPTSSYPRAYITRIRKYAELILGKICREERKTYLSSEKLAA